MTLQAGVPIATNPWKYIPLTHGGPSQSVPWTLVQGPKFVSVAAKERFDGIVVSPFSSLAPVGLLPIAWNPAAPLSKTAMANVATSSQHAAPAPVSVSSVVSPIAPKTLATVISPQLGAAASQRFDATVAASSNRLMAEHATLSLCRAGYSASNDAYILASILHHGGIGACSFEQISDDIRADPAHALDFFFTSRSPTQLEARAKSLLKVAMKDLGEAHRRADKSAAEAARQAARASSQIQGKLVDEIARALSIGKMLRDRGADLMKQPSKPRVKPPVIVLFEDIEGTGTAKKPATSADAGGEAVVVPRPSKALMGGGSTCKTVPNLLIGSLLRVITAAGPSSLESVTASFLSCSELKSYTEREAASAALDDGAVLDADAIAANAVKLEPSLRQVHHFIETLAIKDALPSSLRGKVWRIRDEYLHLSSMSDSEVARWISENPLPSSKKSKGGVEPSAISKESSALPVVEGVASTIAEPGPSTATSKADPGVPKLSPAAQSILAHLISKAGSSGIDHIVDSFVAYPSAACRGVSKYAVHKDIKAIATRGPTTLGPWRLRPAYADLLDTPVPPRDEAVPIGVSSHSDSVAPASALADSKEDVASVGGASAGSLLGLAGAAKPRLSL